MNNAYILVLLRLLIIISAPAGYTEYVRPRYRCALGVAVRSQRRAAFIPHGTVGYCLRRSVEPSLERSVGRSHARRAIMPLAQTGGGRVHFRALCAFSACCRSLMRRSYCSTIASRSLTGAARVSACVRRRSYCSATQSSAPNIAIGMGSQPARQRSEEAARTAG